MASPPGSPLRGEEDDAASLIGQCKAQKRKELSLSGLQLPEIPIEVFAMQSLRKLSLHHNKLSALPSTIGIITGLRVLTLYMNNLKALPSDIGKLFNLQRLFLSHNLLQALPQEIVKLTALQELSLNSNQFGQFPPQIVELYNLRELYLSNNQIRSLPAKIGNFTQLQRLHVDTNQLRSLPPEIGLISSLKRLYLYNNKLQSLPREVGNLIYLKRLYLHNNQLTGLPPTIDNLQSMTLLDLFDNPMRLTDEGKIKRRGFVSLRDMAATQLMQLVQEEGEEASLSLLCLPNDLRDFLVKMIKRCDGPWCQRVYYGEGVEKVVRKDWKGLSFPVIETYCSFGCVLLRGTGGREQRKKSASRKKLKKAPRRSRDSHSVSPDYSAPYGNILALDLRAQPHVPVRSPPRSRSFGYLST